MWNCLKQLNQVKVELTSSEHDLHDETAVNSKATSTD